MPRLFQITEDDLADLERLLPVVADPLNMRHLDNAMRGKLRRVAAIMSAVRWNYGPPGVVYEIPVDPQSPDAPDFVG